MKINVRVKPNSRVEGVEETAPGEYLVRANAPPVEGAANERVTELLAEHFGRPKSRVHLIRGGKSKIKTFEIE